MRRTLLLSFLLLLLTACQNRPPAPAVTPSPATSATPRPADPPDDPTPRPAATMTTGTEAASTPSPTRDPEPVESAAPATPTVLPVPPDLQGLTVGLWHARPVGQSRAIEALAAAFNAENDVGLTLLPRAFRSDLDLVQTLAALPANERPALLVGAPELSAELAALDLLATGAHTPDTMRFSTDQQVLYVHDEVATRLGIDGAQVGMGTLGEQACAATAAGSTGLLLAEAAPPFLALLAASGVPVDGDGAGLRSPAAATLMGELQSLYSRGCLGVATDVGAAIARFAAGESLYLVAGAAERGAIASAVGTDGPWRALQLPISPDGPERPIEPLLLIPVAGERTGEQAAGIVSDYLRSTRGVEIWRGATGAPEVAADAPSMPGGGVVRALLTEGFLLILEGANAAETLEDLAEEIAPSAAAR